MTSYYTDTNAIPKDLEGRVTHLGLRRGEIAPRIITVGSLGRAKRIATMLDKDPAVHAIASERGFTTFTGRYNGVEVSVVATGMGAPMMDFLVREARAIVDGGMLVVRYGSCGSVAPLARPGTVVANTPGSTYVERRADAFDPSWLACLAGSPYSFSKVIPPDKELAAAVWESLKTSLGDKASQGLNVSADSFYSSQGRVDDRFDDRNGAVLPQLRRRFPTAVSVEMESFWLLHLAACSRGSIRAATAAIVCANRYDGAVIATEELHALELEGGCAVLRAVTTTPLEAAQRQG